MVESDGERITCPDGPLSRVEAWPRPELKPAYLITGSDRPKIETRARATPRHFEPEAVELVTAAGGVRAGRRARLQRRSLFGDARLVVTEASTAAGSRRPARERLEGRGREGDRRVPAAPAPGTVLASSGRS